MPNPSQVIRDYAQMITDARSASELKEIHRELGAKMNSVIAQMPTAETGDYLSALSLLREATKAPYSPDPAKPSCESYISSAVRKIESS